MIQSGFPEGVLSKLSNYSVKETVDRLQDLLKTKGITIYLRIDQQAEAQKAGLTLFPVELLLFGNPRAGTPIMSAFPLSALDLPLKALVWQDNTGKVWLSYNDSAYIQRRYALPEDLVKKTDFSALAEQAVS